MPRRLRNAMGGLVYHVLNRAVGRARLFHRDADYAAFQRILQQACARQPTRLVSYCIMPNHWHMVLWPREDDELSEFMRWLTVTHTQRWHADRRTAGAGPLYQGRFKSFPVQRDDHFLTVCRYVEGNALRAALVPCAKDWPWGTESNSHPRIVYSGGAPWVAYQIQNSKTRSVGAQIIDDDPEPFRSIIATTSYSGDLDIQIESEMNHLWVTWVDSATTVGFSEYSVATRLWSLPRYEPFSSDSVEAARLRIREHVLDLPLRP